MQPLKKKEKTVIDVTNAHGARAGREAWLERVLSLHRKKISERLDKVPRML